MNTHNHIHIKLVTQLISVPEAYHSPKIILLPRFKSNKQAAATTTTTEDRGR